jgi:hypothetical protein
MYGIMDLPLASATSPAECTPYFTPCSRDSIRIKVRMLKLAFCLWDTCETLSQLCLTFILKWDTKALAD